MSFRMTRGDDRLLRFAIKLNGSAYDLTGCTLWFTAKRLLTDSDSLAQIRKGTQPAIAGLVINTPATLGTGYISIFRADTASLPDREKHVLHFDMQLQNAAGNVHTIASGELVIDGDVTKASS